MSSGCRAARRVARGSRSPSTCRARRTRRTSSTPSRPSFGQQLEVLLVGNGEQVVARQKVAFTVHDATQLTVGVVAAQAQGIVAGHPAPRRAGTTSRRSSSRSIPSDLPERLEAWSALDRLVWQDVDTNTLSHRQIAALRGWLALGGRLIIVGGTAGPGVLSGFPDEILPYRPRDTRSTSRPNR